MMHVFHAACLPSASTSCTRLLTPALPASCPAFDGCSEFQTEPLRPLPAFLACLPSLRPTSRAPCSFPCALRMCVDACRLPT